MAPNWSPIAEIALPASVTLSAAWQARLKWIMDFEAGKKFSDPKVQGATDLWRRMQDATCNARKPKL